MVSIELLTGLVERVTYHNPENGYTVAKLKVPRHEDLVTLVGNAARLNPGEHIKAKGQWGRHPKHGPQFKAHQIEVLAPATAVGLEKYLGSGLIKGVGPALAKRLIRRHGTEIIQVIEETPERLMDIPGIGPRRVSMITRAWEEHKAIQEVMVFLQDRGVSTTYAVKIYKTYGDDSLEIVRTTPYRLAEDIWGIGFITADRIARALGIPEDDPGRLRAGLLHTLSQGSDEGHVFLERSALLERAAANLKMESSELEGALGTLAQEEAVILEDRAVYLPALYHCEKNVASRIRERLAETNLDLNAEKLLASVEQKESLTLATGQRMAALGAITHPLYILTGGPGTGKTTVTRTIVKMWELLNKKVLLASPTGKAAKRLSEVTGVEAKTIHRLLEFDPGRFAFTRDQVKPLDCDAVVVDEASMLDLTLMNSLLKAIPEKAQLLLVGDADQLPSVGAGRVLGDLLASEKVPKGELTEIFRQAADSALIQNAHRINRGQMPQLQVPDGAHHSDSYLVPVEDPDDIPATVANVVTKSLSKRFGLHPREDIQVLCPMNRGSAGAHHLNEVLQEALNPDQGGPHASWGAVKFRVGDKVMQLKNNYDKEIFNGDSGTITQINPEEQELKVSFWEREISYDFSDLNELALAYAISVHKSQGSEYPAVVMPMTTQHFPMLNRNLLYTGFTRAKKLIVIVGTPRAIAIALRTLDGHKRNTRLIERLHATL